MSFFKFSHGILFLSIFINLLLTDSYPKNRSQLKYSSNIEETDQLSLRAKLDQLMSDPVCFRSSLGIQILSLDTGEIIFEENSHKLLIPASNMKLLTAVGAIEILGLDFNFVTKIQTDGAVHNGVLEGNLIIKGGGDPTIGARLTSPNFEKMEEGDPLSIFRQWEKQLEHHGILRIRGRILSDNTLFLLEGPGRGWAWNDLPYGYAAVSCSLQFNEGIALAQISPTRPGALAKVIWIPETSLLRWKSYIRTGAYEDIELTWEGRTGEIIFKGAIDPSQDSIWVRVAVDNPTNYFVTLFSEYLRSSRLEVIGTSPKELDKNLSRESPIDLFVHRSPPLGHILHILLKISHNLYSETLLKMMDPADSQKLTKRGLMSLEKFLIQRVGLESNSFVLADGSGLSRHNLISAESLVDLLVFVHKQPYGKQFREWLPSAGTDGTLRNRLKSPSLQGRVQAKTGSMESIRALSGFLQTRHGENLVFSILANHLSGDELKLEIIQTKILEALIGLSISSKKFPIG